MIVIRVLIDLQPEHREAFLAFMNDSITVSNNFDGCLKYQLYQDVQAENTYLLYEEWESQAHFDAYRQSEHMAESGRVLFPMMAGKPDSAYYNATVIS